MLVQGSAHIIWPIIGHEKSLAQTKTKNNLFYTRSLFFQVPHCSFLFIYQSFDATLVYSDSNAQKLFNLFTLNDETYEKTVDFFYSIQYHMFVHEAFNNKKNFFIMPQIELDKYWWKMSVRYIKNVDKFVLLQVSMDFLKDILKIWFFFFLFYILWKNTRKLRCMYLVRISYNKELIKFAPPPLNAKNHKVNGSELRSFTKTAKF